jgi:hypothetical protein
VADRLADSQAGDVCRLANDHFRFAREIAGIPAYFVSVLLTFVNGAARIARDSNEMRVGEFEARLTVTFGRHLFRTRAPLGKLSRKGVSS